jgi:hypothetical protein
MNDSVAASARFAIAEWIDRGEEMTSAEFRRCLERVLPYSDDEATIIFNSATAEQQLALPGTLIPNGCVSCVWSVALRKPALWNHPLSITVLHRIQHDFG